MGRQVSETSREAFAAIEPTLGERQQQVLEAIEKLKEASNYQIALYLKWDINRVTGRVTELRKKGLIELVGKKPGHYNIRSQVWKVAEEKPDVSQPEQMTLIEMDCGE